MIRIGVLGCGYFGAEFARAVKEMKGIQLAAVYSPGKSSERLSSELGCPRASSVNEIMENADIDAVIIATPNYLHHQHVLAAAEAGKHIFCVKPFALDAGGRRDGGSMPESKGYSDGGAYYAFLPWNCQGSGYDSGGLFW